VVLDRPADELRGLPREQLGILARLGIHLAAEPPENPDAVIDALIGYGVRGDPVGRTADLIRWARTVKDEAAVASLDGPSGLDLTTGRPGDPTVIASATVTLALPKSGLLEERVHSVVGRLFVGDIGVPPEVLERIGLGRIHPFSSASILEIDVLD
jgi:NAD(P)H-hydrate epimerase